MVKANGYGLGAVAGGARPRAARSVGLRRGDGRGGAELRAGGHRAGRSSCSARSSPSAIDAVPRARISVPTIGDLDALARLGGPRGSAHSTSRSTPGWPAAGSAGTTRRRSPRRPRCWRGAGLGRGLHPFSLRRHGSGVRSPSSGDRFQATLAALPRRPPLVHAANSAAALRGPDATPPTWSGPASSCTAAAGRRARRPRPVARAARPGGRRAPLVAGRERELRRHLDAPDAVDASRRWASATPTACRARPIAVGHRHRAASSLRGRAVPDRRAGHMDMTHGGGG